MKKKVLMSVCAGVFALGLLTGCQASGDTKENDTQTQETDAEKAAEDGKDDAQSSSDGEQVVLTVFDAHAYGLEEYDEMVKKFEEEHPGVKIEVQHSPNDYDTLLLARLNAGEVPDVFDVESGTKAQMYYDYAYDWSQDEDILALFHDDAIDTGRDENKNVMSLPWTYENMGLIYNKDLFEQAGITELPTTMDELEEACKKLDAAGITAFSMAAKENWVLGQLASHYMMDKSLDAEGVVEAMNNGELTLESMSNFSNLFRLLDLAVKYGPDKPLEIDWENSENMLANGEAAIIHMGSWCQSTLDSFNADANLGFLPCPVSDDPKDVTLLSSCNWTYIVHKDSPNLELAKEYLTYILTSDMGLNWMCDGVGDVPGAKTDQEVAGALANDAAAYIEKGETNGWIHTRYPNGYNDNVGPLLQAYMLGDMSAEDVITEMQNYWVVE